jgi:hypothetical protein
MVKRLLRLWVILLAITGLITCWFTVLAIGKAWIFFLLDSQVQARVHKWEIKAISSSHYALHATYGYSINGQEFTGQTLFSSPRYPNNYAAASGLKIKQEEDIQAWYQKRNPAFSSLQKKFPKKELTNAILTFGVFVYFYFARGLLTSSRKEFLQVSEREGA